MIKKIRNSKGFTLVELILAVALIIILSAVTFVNVAAYMRSMKQLELDGYAKEIFIDAQNHLIMAESNGYYGRSTAPGYFGTLENIPEYTPKNTTLYYFVSPYTDTGTDLKDTLLYRMLPPGSIDVGNTNYIIRYDLNTGRVLDVFCTEKEDTSRYGLNNLQEKYNDLLLNYSGDEKRGLRRSYGTNKSVIGYYGGTKPIEKTDDLEAPELTIENGEELTATVKVKESLAGTEITLMLHIEGLQSGKLKELPVFNGKIDVASEWIISLDSIKSSEGHFGKLFSEFYPGEDISVQAYLFDTSKVSNRAFGNIEITNSLFGNYTEINKNNVTNKNEVIASIENIRHLENLSDLVSNVHTNTSSNLEVEKANQVKNINMASSGFKEGGIIDFYGTESKGLMPIYTGKTLEYEGNNFSLEKIYIEPKAGEYADKDWGIFGKLESKSTVNNLKIIDPSITGKNNVGALVGKSISSQLSGVYVYESEDATTHVKGIKSDGETTGTAGGLVGKMVKMGEDDSRITGCFAAVLVEAKNGNAGGLVGEAVDSSISASYSGGHTSGGKYQTEIAAESWFNNKANIKAENGNAGGLIGNANNSTVQYCYSTCSASGSVAGGFVGSDSGSTIENCYCTGLVNGSKTNNSKNFGGFSGTGSATKYSNDRYLETVVYDYDNPMNATGGSYSGNGIRPMDPDTDKLTKDWEAEYADFTNYDKGAASDAFPYDTALGGYYHHTDDDDNVDHFKYPFKTIMGSPDYKLFTGDLPNVITDPDMLKNHHGDWPMVDTIVINISN